MCSRTTASPPRPLADSGFNAEVPGGIDVVVHRENLAAAHHLLQVIRVAGEPDSAESLRSKEVEEEGGAEEVSS